MDTNIEITNIKKHFLLNIKENNENNENSENIENKKKYTTKLVKKCFNTINEVNISNRIKQISKGPKIINKEAQEYITN